MQQNRWIYDTLQYIIGFFPTIPRTVKYWNDCSVLSESNWEQCTSLHSFKSRKPSTAATQWQSPGVATQTLTWSATTARFYDGFGHPKHVLHICFNISHGELLIFHFLFICPSQFSMSIVFVLFTLAFLTSHPFHFDSMKYTTRCRITYLP